MPFTTSSYEESGSYLSGTIELYSESDASTFISASSTYIYSGSVNDNIIQNYSNGSASTYFIINASCQEITVGPSSHPGKPSVL